MQLFREMKYILISLLFSTEQTDTVFKPNVTKIFDEFSDMVYRIVYVRVSQSSDADDVFQEVFLRLVKHIGKLRSSEHVKTWLIRCTINCCNDHQSNVWQKKTAGIGAGDHVGQTELGHEHIELLDAVRSLTSGHNEVIHLYYYEGLTGKEIAEILDISENTVKSRLRRARFELRSVWGEEDEFYGEK